LLLCVGTEASDLVGLIMWGSAKIHRVCKSPTGAEAITISGMGDQLDNTYHILFWFWPTADPTGEILTDCFSVTSSQHKYCSAVTANLEVDFALIRARVRDGAVVMKHQLGDYMAADGLTKGTVVAQKALTQFLHTNLLGTKGVEMSKIELGVRRKLDSAYAARVIHPNNVSPEYLEKLAQHVNSEFVGVPPRSKFYGNSVFSYH
jgi:hypothetical protein